MRILVVSNLYPPVVRGGYEVECATVVRHLAERHDVLVLSSRLESAGAPADPRVLRELPWLEYGKGDSLRAPLAAVAGARSMRAALARHRPDLAFVWNGAQIPQAALRVLDYAGVPLAYRVCEHWFGRLYAVDTFMRHLRPGERGLRGAWARGMRLWNRRPGLRLELARQVPASISWVSEFVRDAAPLPPTVRPLHQEVLLAVSDHSARFATVERAPANEPTLLFVGRIDEYKGADLAVRALALLEREHGVAARLIVAGRGDAGWLRGIAAAERVAERVALTGPLGFEQLAPHVAAAHAWLAPSRWDEPSGTVLTEAALARVPAVAARAGGMPEVLQEGSEALFFERGDASGLAAALAATLADPGAAAARAERAHARWRERSVDWYLGRMESFVESAVTQ